MTTTDTPALRPYQVGDDLPMACGVQDLARFFGVSTSRIHQLRRAGKFRRFEIKDAIGPKRWSGVLLKRYAEHGRDESRFFGSARRSA